MNMVWVSVAAVKDVAEGLGTEVEANGKKLAIFNKGGTFYAIDNACTHKGGPLGQGSCNGNIVSCPWHGFQFDIITGESKNGVANVNTYKTKIEGDNVLVDV